jgi:uncharacterized protein (TIGR03083 family)
MEFGALVDQIALQASALRAAAVAAGPDARLPTCPGWTVLTLVRHIARVHNWAGHALTTAPDADDLAPDEPPVSWHRVLPWWDDQVTSMIHGLRSRGQDTPAWVFDAEDEPTAMFWARRQAHETAIHRLDAEHAKAGSNVVSAGIFPTELAVDGIDEVLRLWVPRHTGQHPPNLHGSVRFHTTDTRHRWHVRLEPGQPPRVVTRDGGTADATVTGTADAVYRATWHRPTTAAISGNTQLVTALQTP